MLLSNINVQVFVCVEVQAFVYIAYDQIYICAASLTLAQSSV